VPSVGFGIADRSHDAGRFTRFQDHHRSVGFRISEVWINEVIAAAFRSVHDRDAALARPIFQPILKLLGNAAQRISGDRIELPIGIEEADNPFWLLERLDQPIQQDAIKATIVPTNAPFVVFEERVHERPPVERSSTRVPPLVRPLYPSHGRRDIKGEALG